MKKKFSLIALALLLVMVLATYLVACNPDTPDNGGDTPDAPCVHAYDNACDTTCNLCGDVRTIEHSFASTFTQDTATHYYLCSVCGEKKDESEHVFDNRCDTTCDICGLVRETEHKYSYSCDPECDVCGTTREDVEHLFKSDCDKACLNGCGFTRETEHVFADVLTQDTATHYYLCSVCGAKKDEESHSFTNTCDTDCNDCGATREITHKFSNTCDTDCNVCGTTREITHTYDNACDTKCDVCNESRTVAPHADGNNDCRCDACSILLGHTDSNTDCVCDTCSATLHADSNADSVCDGCSVTLYKVTLDFQDEDVTNEIFYVVKDAKISSLLPTLVGNQYKNFSGWYKNANGTGKWLSSSKVTADITLYPGWNYNKQEVVFDLNYAGASKPTGEYRPLSLPLDLSSVPTREYWVFAGWYLDAALTTPYDVDELFLATSRLTLFASWEIDPAHTHTYEKSVVDVTCLTDGYDLYTCVCGTTYKENVIPATGHDLSFEVGDFMGMAICANEGCQYAERRQSIRIYEDVFVYTFDDAKKADIQKDLNALLDMLKTAEKYDQAIHFYDETSPLYAKMETLAELYDVFYNDLMYLTEQYQYAYVFYCVKQSTENTNAFQAVSDYRTEVITSYYSIFGLAYESAYREYFYAGWDEEEILEAVEMSKSYGDAEYAKINKRLSEIELRSQEISSGSAEIPVLYEEFVKLKNQLAQLAGYDNYLEYAYASEYGRDYSPEESKVMRSFVKEYLVDVYKAAQTGKATANSPAIGSVGASYMAAIGSSVFDTALSSNLIKDYFKTMTSTAHEKEIDFYYHANELFKNGNYFRGSYSGAYSYWIPAQQATILYFGPTSYSASFTFVHEFGHYYNNVYNPNASMALDIDEVHSQGNEMLFLAYLEEVLPKEVLREMYAKLYYGQLEDMLNVIMIASAVDEFEYCVYNGVSPLGVPTTYTKNDYDSLFISILSMYGIGSGSSSYWRQVAIRSSGYYISYAMSALPCVELLSVAETEGFEAAQSVYFKFFAFTDEAENVEVNSDGDKIATLTYAETLEYTGLHSVFDEDMYTYVANYFLNTEKDFTYAD